LLHYRLGTASGPAPYLIAGDWASDWNRVASQESWFEHASGTGRRLHNDQWNWDLHDITNLDFRRYWVDSTIADMRATGAQGLRRQLHRRHRRTLGQSYRRPRFDGTGATTGPCGPAGTWLDRLASFSDYVKTAYVGTSEQFLLIPNLDGLTTSWAAVATSAVDGALLEGSRWMRPAIEPTPRSTRPLWIGRCGYPGQGRS
jgi:hypothetical protein